VIFNRSYNAEPKEDEIEVYNYDIPDSLYREVNKQTSLFYHLGTLNLQFSKNIMEMKNYFNAEQNSILIHYKCNVKNGIGLNGCS